MFTLLAFCMFVYGAWQFTIGFLILAWFFGEFEEQRL